MLRQCPIRSPLDPVVQVLEIALEVCWVCACSACRSAFGETLGRLFPNGGMLIFSTYFVVHVGLLLAKDNRDRSGGGSGALICLCRPIWL